MVLTAKADAHICSEQNQHESVHTKKHIGVSYKSDTRRI